MKKTAILYFSRSPEEERKFKNLDPNFTKSTSLRLFQLLHKRTADILKRTGLDVFEISEEDQIGQSFGDKLANAFSQIFEKNYEAVIAVGNDCLDLKSSNLLNAAKLLKNQNLVLGPDQREGLYLIGIQKQAFFKAEFRKLNWQSPELKKSIINYIQNNNLKCNFFRIYSDINSSKDLQDYLALNSKKRISLIILSLIQFTMAPLEIFSSGRAEKKLNQIQYLRGPPLFLISV